MERAPSPAQQALRSCAATVRSRALAWRTGADPSPNFGLLSEELPPEGLRAVLEVSGGDVEAPAPVKTLASRVRAILDAAGKLDALCEAMTAARTEPDAGPPTLPEESLAAALLDSDGSRAGALFKEAQQSVSQVARDEAPAAVAALSSWVKDEDAAEGARAFLAATRDAWRDALGDMEKRSLPPRGMSGAVFHARTMACPPLAEGVTPDAARHVARQAVEHLLQGASLAPRRMSTRAWMHLPGVATLSEDGQPRIAWVARRGAPAAAELVGLTVEACFLALRPRLTAEEPARVLGLCARLGSVLGPVVRNGMGLAREDAWKAQRHGALWLLREARVHAALAVQKPSSPGEAMDALATATTATPDLAEALARVAPFPDGSPFTRLLASRPGRAWLGWSHAGQLAALAREQWDEDYVGRPVFQHALRELPPVDGSAALVQALGGKPDGSGEALRLWLEALLA